MQDFMPRLLTIPRGLLGRSHVQYIIYSPGERRQSINAVPHLGESENANV